MYLTFFLVSRIFELHHRNLLKAEKAKIERTTLNIGKINSTKNENIKNLTNVKEIYKIIITLIYLKGVAHYFNLVF